MPERGGAPQDDFFSAENISATTNVFYLRGGRYGVIVKGDFTGGGSIALQVKDPSGSFITVKDIAGNSASFTADGYKTADLPTGICQLVVTGTIAATYATVAPIPVRRH